MDKGNKIKEENQSSRIAKDLENHNCVLNKINHQQTGIVAAKKQSLAAKNQSVPVSIRLDLLFKKTHKSSKLLTILNKATTITKQKMETFPKNYRQNNNTSRPQTPNTPGPQSIKHYLPVPLLPNREKYNENKNVELKHVVQNTLKSNKVENMKVSAGTQTNKIYILSAEDYIFYVKCRQNTCIDLTNNTSEEEKPNTDQENRIVLDEKSMAEILNNSEGFKRLISTMSLSLKKIFEATSKGLNKENLYVLLEKKKQILNAVEKVIEELFDDDVNQELIETTRLITKGPAIMHVQHLDQEQLVRRKLIEKLMQQDKKSQLQQNKGPANNQTVNVNRDSHHNQAAYNCEQNPMHANLKNNNAMTSNLSSRDPRIRGTGYTSQNGGENQLNSQHYKYWHMIQRQRALDSATARKNYNTANQRAQFRCPREEWPYSRRPTMELAQTQEMQHQGNQYYSYPQHYVPQNQYQDQQQRRFYQQQAQIQNTMQPQQVMYNDIYS